ncbi:MAG: PorT family protein [Treponema sp.]|nr:PorT family protein [Treponema sp.]
MDQLPILNPVPYAPRPVFVEDFPEISGLPVDEPPDPFYLGDSPYALTGEYYFDDEAMLHLMVWLWNSANGSLVYVDHLLAEDIEEAKGYLPPMITWIFSRIGSDDGPSLRETVVYMGDKETLKVGTISGRGETSGMEETLATDPFPEKTLAVFSAIEDDPLNRRLYIGFSAGFSLNSYTVAGSGNNNVMNQNFSYRQTVLGEFRILPWLSIQTEIAFTMDTLTISTSRFVANNYLSYVDHISNMTLILPLIVKFPFRFSFMIFSPYAGGYFFLPLGPMVQETNNIYENSGSYSYTVSPPLGLLAGAGIGFRLGPGILFGETRYSTDLGVTKVEKKSLAYTRSRLTIALGYQFGIWGKSK